MNPDCSISRDWSGPASGAGFWGLTGGAVGGDRALSEPIRVFM
jgi:hypothetical protein